ncbi:sugar phosphate isomerase/epimerase [Sphingopyxis sp. L1A2A]|uniref:sugar phosphate isomerase/epimerase family protein n=1 Tax=Sphingopyxis sp. L1A2A TaxID=2502247 RepID=UPI0010F4A983|nr:sugar phosphate isomerase/epimerase [Sphingopyxis sp. L1A2A]
MVAPSPLLSLAAGVMPEFSPGQTVAAAAKSGWSAVGIWYDPATWTPATTIEIRDRVADAGLVVLDIEVIWLKPGPDDPAHFAAIDAGAAIGARNVLVVSSEPNPAQTAAKLARLSDHAAAAGIRVCLELAAFTTVGNVQAALVILDTAGCEDVGLLIDPLHLARTGGAPADLAAINPRRFPYAQFCDAPARGPPPSDVPAIIHEALDLRLMPGDGALPLAELLAVLPHDTPLSVELRSAALRESYPDPTQRARALLDATQRWLR